MKKKLTKVLALIGALAMTLSMNTLVFGADDDIVLDGAGDKQAALQREIDPGDTPEGADPYKYIGWAYAGAEVEGSYKYLKLTYSGDDECFKQIRLQLVQPDGDPNGAGILSNIIWFGENKEGTFKTVEGKNCPDATKDPQTVYIDLEKSGFDLSEGIRAFHIHSTTGLGKVTFSEAVLTKTAPGATDDGNSGDAKETKEETTTKVQTEKIYPGSADSATESGSAASWALPVAIVVGAVVIAVVVVVVTKNGKKEEK